MCVRILSNSSIIKLKAEMVATTCFVMPTTCFGMPTNETKGMMHYSGLKGTPVQIQHVAKNFFASILRSFDIPVKRISLMMLTSIFLTKCSDRKKSHFK
jgi:hypothetical protein